jgi:hypothetical protein
MRLLVFIKVVLQFNSRFQGGCRPPAVAVVIPLLKRILFSATSLTGTRPERKSNGREPVMPQWRRNLINPWLQPGEFETQNT